MNIKTITLAILLLPLIAFSAANPILPNSYTTNTQSGADAYVQNIASGQITAPSIALVGGVTNWVTFMELTNGILYGNGTYYAFPNSQTLGINELQSLFPINTNYATGISIEFGQGYYNFTAPIRITNAMRLSGQGYASTVLRYTGPTNLFSTTNIMYALAQSAGNPWYQTNLAQVSLIGIYNPPTWKPAGTAPYGYVDLDRLAIQVSTDCPCILIGGNVTTFYANGVGLFGPDVLGPLGYGSAFQPIEAAHPLQAIGLAIQANQPLFFDNGLVSELAAGLYNIGNSYYSVRNTGTYFIGRSSVTSAYTNAYPNTNWLSLGPAIYSSGGSYTAEYINDFPYNNAIDVFQDGGSATMRTYAPQGSLCSIAVGNSSAISYDDVQNGLNNGNGAYDAVVIGADKVYRLTNIVTTATNGAPSFIASTGPDPNSGGYAWDCQINGQFAFGLCLGDPNDQVLLAPQGMYFASNLPITGNGSGLTNLASLVWTNSGASGYLTTGGFKTVSATGIVRATIATSGTQVTWLTNGTTGDACVVSNAITAVLLPASAGDSLAVTNVSGSGSLVNSRFYSLH